MNITLRQISYFVATADSGSLSAAALALRISQSAITESIRALEDQTGAQLFTRHSRGVSLTHQGHIFYRHAKMVQASVGEIAHAMTSRQEAVSGQLNLGVTSLVAGYFLADLLARFRRVFPDVSVRVIEDDRSYLEHLLINGELNLALMLISDIEDQSALAKETLVRSPFRVWLSAKHRLVEHERVTMADLQQEKLIALSTDEMADVYQRWMHAEELLGNIILRTSSVEAVRSLVATDAGVAILPDLAFRPYSLEGDRLEARQITGFSHSFDVGLAWRLGAQATSSAEIFRTLARDFRAGR